MHRKRKILLVDNSILLFLYIFTLLRFSCLLCLFFDMNQFTYITIITVQRGDRNYSIKHFRPKLNRVNFSFFFNYSNSSTHQFTIFVCFIRIICAAIYHTDWVLEATSKTNHVTWIQIKLNMGNKIMFKWW